MPIGWAGWCGFDSTPPPQHVRERERRMTEKLTHGPGKRKRKKRR